MSDTVERTSAVKSILAGCLVFLWTVQLGAQTPGESALIAHSNEFKREVIRVTEGVFVAVGFGNANSILIVGDDGRIIVDTMEGDDAARDVKAEFDRISRAPVRAIIYTHGHPDHLLGSDVMAGADNPDIYAQAAFASEQLGVNPVRGAIASRSLRQFGVELSPADRPNLGVGPALRMDWTGKDTFLKPTKVVADRLDVVVAGVRLSLVHAPGENPDEMYVFLPDKSVILPGDNYYHAFPNLSPIRGGSYRDPRLWAASLTRIIGEGAEYLVPSHTRPVMGRDEVRRRLTAYRDAIVSVWEQTIDGINRGLTPDQLVEAVKLSDELSKAPNLQQFYGTVAWSVRSIYAGTVGWFNGNPTELFPLSVSERARRIVDMAGGEAKLLALARSALERDDAQWASELADHLLALDVNLREARLLKATALEKLARNQTSANGRNYYLSVAKQLRTAAK